MFNATASSSPASTGPTAGARYHTKGKVSVRSLGSCCVQCGFHRKLNISFGTSVLPTTDVPRGVHLSLASVPLFLLFLLLLLVLPTTPVPAPPCVSCARLLAMSRPLLIALFPLFFPPTFPSSLLQLAAFAPSTHAAGAGCALPPVPTTVSRSFRGRM